MKKIILLATPNVGFGRQLQSSIENNENYFVHDLISSDDDLFSVLEDAREKNIEIRGLLITSDLARKLRDKRLEHLADMLYTVRQRYPNILVTLLSNESRGHPFLAEMVQIGIYNIFMKGSMTNFDVTTLLSMFDQAKTFAEASHYLEVDSAISWRTSIQTPKEIQIKSIADSKKESEPEEKKEKRENLEPNSTKNKTSVKTITQTIGVPLQTKIILFGGSSNRVGTSTIAQELAFHLVKNNVTTSYIEHPNLHSFTIERYKNEKMRDLYQDQHIVKATINDVSMILNQPSHDEHLTSNEMIKLTLGEKTVVRIIDIGTLWNDKNVQELIGIADHLFLVSDIDPLLLVRATELEFKNILYSINQIRENVSIIINRAEEDYINHHFFRSIRKQVMTFPTIDEKTIFKSIINGKRFEHNSDDQHNIVSFFEKVLPLFLPKEIGKQKKKSLFPKIDFLKKVKQT